MTSLLLHIWREVGRHLEIHESVERVVPALRERLPLGTILVRRIDLARSCLETVARGAADGAPAADGTKTPLGDAERERVLEWGGVGDVASVSASDPHSPLRVLDPAADHSAFLAGPLLDDAQSPLGVLVFVARPGVRFRAEHVALAQQLLEPFAAALENDSRLREMRAMREALEADKQALLSRLDRQDITDSIVGADTGLRPVMERVEQVAKSDVPVLILGETGSGKEVVARAIHARSARAGGPILRVNCGAIPPELVDSELFGHERGSFTGAAAARKGWFERADGGTLFLDEIGELPVAAQVRMLRILQDGTFERVGGQRTQSVNVRVVAATHADLHGMVAGGRFRQDLWYRISVFPIHLPPLRDRPADIPAFAAHFAARAGRRLGGHALVPTPRDVALLLAYPWPGNVRELAAVIERAAILGNGKSLEVAQALGTGPGPARPAIETVAGVLPSATSFPVRPEVVSLDRATVQHIEAALRAALGRVEGPFGAAKMLNVNPHTLRSRMRKLGVDAKRFRSAT